MLGLPGTRQTGRSGFTSTTYWPCVGTSIIPEPKCPRRRHKVRPLMFLILMINARIGLYHLRMAWGGGLRISTIGRYGCCGILRIDSQRRQAPSEPSTRCRNS